MANGPGGATDSQGRAVLDPSENVKALNQAGLKAESDLRRADARRQDDLRETEARHIREVLRMRSDHELERRRSDAIHQRELRDAESDRLDAIRTTDQGQVQRAAEVQATQATALAAQVTATADAFRAGLAAALEPLQKDIADLRRSQYELAGQRAQSTESGTSGRQWIGLAIAGLALLSTFSIGTAGIVITLLLRSG